MLTKKSKTLLNSLNKLHAKGIDYPNMALLEANTSLTGKEIMLISLYLSEEGYVHVDYGDGDTILLIESKFKGKNYKELIRKERLSFFYRSIIVPIIVSLVASTLFWLIE